MIRLSACFCAARLVRPLERVACPRGRLRGHVRGQGDNMPRQTTARQQWAGRLWACHPAFWLMLLLAPALAAAAEPDAAAAPFTLVPMPDVPGMAPGVTPAPASTTATPIATPTTTAKPLPAKAAPIAGKTPAAAPSSRWEDYRILSERNIFVRNRSSGTGRSSMSAASVAPPRPAADSNDARLVLTGIVQQGAGHVAFFEDTRSGKTTTAAVGESIGRGRVTAITLDAVQYAADGAAVKIAIGSSLAGVAVSMPRPAAVTTTTSTAGVRPPTGTTPPPAGLLPVAPGATVTAPAAGAPSATAVAAPTTSSPAAPTAPAAGAPTESKDSAASILERMRLRREQELNR